MVEPSKRTRRANNAVRVVLAVAGVCLLALVIAQVRGSSSRPENVADLRADAVAACVRAVDIGLRDACECAFDRAVADRSIDLVELDVEFDRGSADDALRDAVEPCLARSGQRSGTSG